MYFDTNCISLFLSCLYSLPIPSLGCEIKYMKIKFRNAKSENISIFFTDTKHMQNNPEKTRL